VYYTLSKNDVETCKNSSRRLLQFLRRDDENIIMMRHHHYQHQYHHHHHHRRSSVDSTRPVQYVIGSHAAGGVLCGPYRHGRCPPGYRYLSRGYM